MGVKSVFGTATAFFCMATLFQIEHKSLAPIRLSTFVNQVCINIQPISRDRPSIHEEHQKLQRRARRACASCVLHPALSPMRILMPSICAQMRLEPRLNPSFDELQFATPCDASFPVDSTAAVTDHVFALCVSSIRSRNGLQELTN